MWRMIGDEGIHDPHASSPADGSETEGGMGVLDLFHLFESFECIYC